MSTDEQVRWSLIVMPESAWTLININEARVQEKKRKKGPHEEKANGP